MSSENKSVYIINQDPHLSVIHSKNIQNLGINEDQITIISNEQALLDFSSSEELDSDLKVIILDLDFHSDHLAKAEIIDALKSRKTKGDTSTPIIGLSSENNPAIVQEALRSGVNIVIPKTTDINTVKQLVALYMGIKYEDNI